MTEYSLIQALGGNGFDSGFIKVIAAVIFAAGIIQCFYGFKLFKFWIAVDGFLTFGAIGILLSISMDAEMGMIIFWGLVGAVIGAVIAYKLYKFGVFILCSTMGFLLGYLLTQEMSLGIVLGIITGAIALVFIRPFIIISTSISGGIAAGTSLGFLLDMYGSKNIILIVVLAGLGLFVQFKMNPEKGTAKTSKPVQEDTVSDANKQLLVDGEAIKKEVIDNAVSLQKKIEKDCLDAIKTCKETSADEVLDDLKYVLYSQRVLKYIMPFAEYILYAVAIFMCFDLLFGHQAYGSSLILLIIGGLVLAKKRFGAVGISFLVVGVSRIIVIGKSLAYIENMFYFLADTAIISCMAFGAFAYYFKYTDTERLGSAFNNLLKEIKAAIKNSQINTVETVSETTANQSDEYENKETPKETENIEEAAKCSECRKVNKSGAKFCSQCGAKLTTLE